MGLSTSQVRLLALTSRKADVEMQMQLNSKRKTMLTREATELAKLYSAKLQNTKIQYATSEGYNDVTYEYLMAQDNSTFVSQIMAGTSTPYRKNSDGIVLTDTYGRVILSDAMYDVVLSALNDNGLPSGEGHYADRSKYTANPPAPDEPETIESLTLLAIKHLLIKNEDNDGVKILSTVYQKLLEGSYNGSSSPSLEEKKSGTEFLKYLYENGYHYGGAVYTKDGGVTWYSSSDFKDSSKIDSLTPGVFYVPKNDSYQLVCPGGSDGVMYLGGSGSHLKAGFLPNVTATYAKQIANIMNYYGCIFSAAFKGSQTVNAGSGVTTTLSHFNVAFDTSELENTGMSVSGNFKDQFKILGNSKYTGVQKENALQEGLKSGVYQLVNVVNKQTGEFGKGQNLDYFSAANLVVEKSDQMERESITAWYNAARADLNEKETYWDSEMTALSSELSSITTEIDSVKKLREDAISTTFKWGNA